MWEILLHNADWDCFKILTLWEILKIQHPLPEERFTTRRMDSKKHENWACIQKSRPVVSTANMGLKFEFGLWHKIILNLVSEYVMERSNV